VLAGIPNLVADDELADANALLQFVEWTTTIAGSAAGGAIVAASGPHLAYWVNTVTFALSVSFILRIPSRLLQSERSIGRGHWSDLREGFDAVLRSRSLTTVLVAWSIAHVAIGCINLAEIFLAKRSYGSGNVGFGVLAAASGVGLVIGGLSARGVESRFGVTAAYPRTLLVFALGAAGAAAAPTVWVGALAMIVNGIGNGVVVVLNITLVQRGAADRIRGRALTAIIAVNSAVLLAVFIAAGPLTNAVGARVVYTVAAGSLVLAAAAAAWLLPHQESV
jgi:Na+/melibiose symporter-like transporter